MTVCFIPSPSISQFSLGPINIKVYALSILAGILIAMFITNRRWKRVGGDFNQILDIILLSLPIGIVGARLYHVITTPERFFGSHGDFLEIFRIWNGGLGIWGGIFLGAIAACVFCKHRKYPAGLLADAAAPAILIAQGIGRLGNWFNQELYGAPTTLPWGLKLNYNATQAIGHAERCYDGLTCPAGTLFHPTFLYEMIWNFIGAALLICFGKMLMAKLKAGSLFMLYVMWYTLGRVWIEALRIDFSHVFLGVRINVWVSIIVFIFAAVGFALLQKSNTTREMLIERLIDITSDEREREEQNISSKKIKSTLKK
ncbi:prolipoprotein diacylglyceryl transferase [Gardnerella greenwoodii]|uniref:Phosphatidylglycerol--prolipoprotein diacylglyceryl transferase n=1 Tax=Gardnerella greenwoodii TaxID=2914925 RepID=A0A2N6RXP6_9BIFI|nr:prolipoprotein diacylglyceryl transferase [Gardnerella greenwoodii]MDF0753156.1 prolipoprotein diacylglyceryl transferase [Gardnerella greenwoodii]PMC42900.1 prolipoprotein diacylglyceryl transferase [Gardnerella greenwoodii]